MAVKGEAGFPENKTLATLFKPAYAFCVFTNITYLHSDFWSERSGASARPQLGCMVLSSFACST